MRALSPTVILLLLAHCYAQHKTRELPCTMKGLWLDVAVVIDFSHKMGTNGVLQAASDVSALFYNSNISQNIGQYTRISISNYTEEFHEFEALTYFTSTRQFEDEIYNIVPMQTTEPDAYIAGGLQGAGISLRNGRSNGKRDNVPQVVMLFAADYSSSTNGGAVIQANILKSNGIKVVVIDSSKAQNLNGLGDIASPGMVFLGNDPQILAKVEAALCTANSFCPNDWTQVSDSFPISSKMRGECLRRVEFAPTYGVLNRTMAVSACNSLGGYLVSEFDESKNNFTYAFADATNPSNNQPLYFLGLSFSPSSGQKQWDQMPGKSPLPFSTSDYSHWNPNTDPLVSNTPHVIVGFNDGYWTAIREEFYGGPICQTNTCDTDNFATDPL